MAARERGNKTSPGTGNWKNAPKKVDKPKSATTSPSSSSKRSAPPKPKTKPAKPKAAAPKPKAKPESVKAKGYKRTMDNAGGPRKTEGSTKKAQKARQPSARSGASRSVKSKVDNSVGARLVRGAKRLFGSSATRKTTGNKNFKANRPR